MTYKMLPFDTALFGYKVARLSDDLIAPQLQSVLSVLQKKSVRLVYWFVNSDDEAKNSVAKISKGVFADEKITYVRNTHPLPSTHGLQIYSYKKKTVTPDILNLALQSGAFSRFKKDRHFVHKEFEKLYTMWITNAVQRSRAVDVLVYHEHLMSEGLITLEHKGTIGLLAVARASRGKSIGRHLVAGALGRFHNQGFRKVHVTTQKRNIIACKFYESLGFTVEKIEHVYHFWL